MLARYNGLRPVKFGALRPVKFGSFLPALPKSLPGNTTGSLDLVYYALAGAGAWFAWKKFGKRKA